MDNFRVEIDVQSYLTFVDGRRVYRRGKTWDFAAGRDLSVAQLTTVVEEQFQWSSDQRMTIWHGAGDAGTVDVDNSYDEQNVPGDDESIIATNVVPTHIHDRNCPQIKEKSTFVDGKTFKVALRQLAIREVWSFNTEYSDKKRLRASCSDKDCPWRIHAAKLEGCNTFMVIQYIYALVYAAKLEEILNYALVAAIYTTRSCEP